MNSKIKDKARSTSAITLIALVVSVIVLLILAGVAIHMVIGESGIFEKQKNLALKQ